MRPVHRLEHDLSVHVAIEDERRGGAMPALASSTVRATFLSSSRRARVEPSMPRSTAPLLTMSVRLRAALGHRPREGITPSGYQRHVHAGIYGGMNRVAVAWGNAPRIEQCAVHVDADKLDHQAS
jgi:hypothetical protein